MKQLIRNAALTLATLSAVVFAPVASAQSQFNVDLTLTPKCYINMVAGTPADVDTTDVTLTYTSFQDTDAESSTGFNVTCTNTLGYSIAVTADTNTIAGIDYFLKLAAGTTAQYTSATGGGALSTLAGTGSAQAYTIGVRAPKDQPGTCATGTCNSSNTHTITVSY